MDNAQIYSIKLTTTPYKSMNSNKIGKSRLDLHHAKDMINDTVCLKNKRHFKFPVSTAKPTTWELSNHLQF